MLDNRLSIVATGGWQPAIAHRKNPRGRWNEPPTGGDDRPEQKTAPLAIDGNTAHERLLCGVGRCDPEERGKDDERRSEGVAAWISGRRPHNQTGREEGTEETACRFERRPDEAV